MKVGDYVRTRDGKIFKWNIVCKIKQEWPEEYINEYTRFCYIDKNDIIKSSPNIIDLIEEFDVIKFIYRGEEYISNVTKSGEFCMVSITPHWNASINAVEIKSTVTKEQFESIEYKVGE